MSTTVQTADEMQIRELIADRQSAMRARDAERIVADYAPGAVKFDLAPPLQHTGSEVHDANALQAWFSGFEGAIEYEIRDLAVTASSDIAFCHSLNRLAAKPSAYPEKFDLWFRATVCLKKIEGAWQIAHEHTSTPFYMEGSFDAALDLKP